MDAITGTIIQQLSLAVKAYVGLKLARMLQTDDKITGVLAEVQVWFREQATPSIFDDIWTRNGVDVKVLNNVSELVNDLPRESLERSRILYSIRDPDLEATGKPFSFKLGDHRVNRALEILLKVTGECRHPESCFPESCELEVLSSLVLVYIGQLYYLYLHRTSAVGIA